MPAGKATSSRLIRGLIPLGVAVIAFSLYLLYLSYYPPGYFGDDAIYLIGARSLLQGRFNYLFLPGQPPINLYFPGFPLLLALLMPLFHAHWSWYALVSLASTAGFCLFTAKLLKPESIGDWAVLALIAWNPLTCIYSGTIMTEPSYTLLVMAAFVYSRQLYAEPLNRARAIRLGLLLGCATLIRLPGLCLLLAVTAGLAFQRLRIAAVRVGVIGGTVAALALVRNYALTRTATSYLGEWQSQSAHPTLASLVPFLGRLFAETLPGLIGVVSGTVVIYVLATAAGLWLLWRGTQRFFTTRALPNGFALSVAVFLGTHLLLHSLWIGFDYRYYLPVLPWIFLLIAEGVRSFDLKPLGPILALLVVGLYGRWHWTTLQPGTRMTLPVQSYRWISEQTQPGDIIDSARAPTLYLYTGRQGTPPPSLQSPELLRYWLLKRNIAYVFDEDAALMTEARAQVWQMHRTWLSTAPKLYPLVYQNEVEHVRIYQVPADPVFLRNFEARLFTRQSFDKIPPR